MAKVPFLINRDPLQIGKYLGKDILSIRIIFFCAVFLSAHLSWANCLQESPDIKKNIVLVGEHHQHPASIEIKNLLLSLSSAENINLLSEVAIEDALFAKGGNVDDVLQLFESKNIKRHTNLHGLESELLYGALLTYTLQDQFLYERESLSVLLAKHIYTHRFLNLFREIFETVVIEIVKGKDQQQQLLELSRRRTLQLTAQNKNQIIENLANKISAITLSHDEATKLQMSLHRAFIERANSRQTLELQGLHLPIYGHKDDYQKIGIFPHPLPAMRTFLPGSVVDKVTLLRDDFFAQKIVDHLCQSTESIFFILVGDGHSQGIKDHLKTTFANNQLNLVHFKSYEPNGYQLLIKTLEHILMK